MDTHFKWPCSRHYAHGPHRQGDIGKPRAGGYDCPGVKAHPNTMIGRQG